GADHLLVEDGLPQDVGALAAVLAGPAHGEVARVVHRALPRLRLGDACPVRRALDGIVAALALRDVLLEPRAHLALECQLLGRVREVHPTRLARGPSSHQRRRTPYFLKTTSAETTVKSSSSACATSSRSNGSRWWNGRLATRATCRNPMSSCRNPLTASCSGMKRSRAA